METYTFNNTANEHYFDYKNIEFLKDISNEFTGQALAVYIDTDDKQNMLTQYVLKHGTDIKRGDTLVFCDPEQRYRNTATCLWNGKSIELLDHDIDDYGALPKTFKISPNTFGPKYWKNVIAHNEYYWICDEYRQEACDNATKIIKLYDGEVKDFFVSHYTHNGVVEHVVLNNYYDNNDYMIEKFQKLLLNKKIPFGFDGSDYRQLFDDKKNISVIQDFHI